MFSELLVLENSCKWMYYERPIITDSKVTNNRPDMIVLNKTNNYEFLIDVSCPNNNNLWNNRQCGM